MPSPKLKMLVKFAMKELAKKADEIKALEDRLGVVIELSRNPPQAS